MISSIVKGMNGRRVRKAGRGYMNKKFSLCNIEVTQYFNYEPRFNNVFSRNNLPGIKDGAYVINLNDKKVKEHIGFHYLLTEI